MKEEREKFPAFQRSAHRHGLLRLVQQLFQAAVAGGAAAAGAGLAADFPDGRQTADGNGVGNGAVADGEAMADDRLGTVGRRVGLSENLHGRDDAGSSCGG